MSRELRGAGPSGNVGVALSIYRHAHTPIEAGAAKVCREAQARIDDQQQTSIVLRDLESDSRAVDRIVAIDPALASDEV